MKHLLHILEGRLQTLPVRMAVQLPAGQQLGARDAAVTLRFRYRMALVALASGDIGKVGAAIVEGKVALVVGGGSGHYPAFAGFVGPGMADAAVAGDVFASPSAHSVAHVTRLAHRGGG